MHVKVGWSFPARLYVLTPQPCRMDSFENAGRLTHVGHSALSDGLLRMQDAIDGFGGQRFDLALRQRLDDIRQPENFFPTTSSRQSARGQVCGGRGGGERLRQLQNRVATWLTSDGSLGLCGRKDGFREPLRCSGRHFLSLFCVTSHHRNGLSHHHSWEFPLN